MQAEQDLLVLLGLVVKLLQVRRPVVRVLGQHQLDVAAEGQILREKQQHLRKHIRAEAAVRVCVERVERTKKGIKNQHSKMTKPVTS